MTVAYEPPLTRSRPNHGDSLEREVIAQGPPYLRGPRQGRWHRVRSAERVLHENHRNGLVGIRETYTLWCGPFQSQWDVDRAGETLLFADVVPAGEPSCGTCEGRAIGAGQTGEPTSWLFSPRRLDQPKVCPGSRTMLVREDQAVYNRATCLVCGDVVAMRASGGPYSPRWGAVTHQPGPELVDGCQWHAWRDLVIARGSDDVDVVACRCRTVERPATSC